MRKISLFFAFIFLLTASGWSAPSIRIAGATAKISDLDFSDLGLMAHLIYVKTVSENYIRIKLAQVEEAENELKKPAAGNATVVAAIIESRNAVKRAALSELATAIDLYNRTKLAYDQVLFQLSGDMKMKNSVWRYRWLNRKLFKAGSIAAMDNNKGFLWREKYITKLQAAAVLFGEIQAGYDNASPPSNTVNKAFTADLPLSDALTLAWTMWKEGAELRGKKVDAISAQLEKLSLSSVEELKKPKEKEEEKK